MFDKGKREQRHDKEDAAFNKMLLWLVGAGVVELFILLIKQIYVNFLLDTAGADVLHAFFSVFRIAGAVLAVAGLVWTVLKRRKGEPAVLPGALTGAVAGLWVLSVFAYYLYDVGLNIVMLLPAVAAVLIVIFFLYQRAFFLNAVLAAGGLLSLWLYRQYYGEHPTMVTALFVAGFVLLAAALVLTFVLRGSGGRLAGLQLMPADTSYVTTWLTCVVTAAAMALALVLGAAAAFPLLFVVVGWVFVQAVFFTVKLM